MVLPLFRQGYAGQQSGEPLDPLPNFIPQSESPQTNPELAARYPLNLLSPKSHAFLNSSYGNLKAQVYHAGAQRVLINPAPVRAPSPPAIRCACSTTAACSKQWLS